MRRVRAHADALGVLHPVWGVNDKDDAHAWARALGVATPVLLGVHDDAADVPFGDLPDEVVVKPARGSSSRGVHLLRRTGRGQWWEVRTRRLLQDRDVVGRLQDLAGAGRTSASVVVEEMVVDPRSPQGPPVDWKVHTFYGQLGVIVGKVLRPERPRGQQVRWRIFDDTWTDLGRAVDRHPLDRTIQPPVHAAQLVDVARRVSAAVPRSFVRVDLYDGVEGIVFGEVTPEPGGDHVFRRDVDRAMGHLCEQAEARLLARAVASGLLDPEGAAPTTGTGPGRPPGGGPAAG